MKQIIKVGLPMISMVAMVACGGNEAKNDHQEDGHDHAARQNNQQPVEQAQQTASVKLKDDNLNAVYQHYVHLSTALVNSDANEAKVAANAIEAGAKQMSGGGTIASAAAKITTAKDLETQRKHYETLSNEMTKLVKQAGLESGQVYVQHCPMAFNDKGASWLSSNEEIRNPYFGDKMLKCGEVKETIK
ncbi:DUF3347 domain-containing protein [Aridibaculum aurantiacum]|uniref:DUF3347 domain-containing protein n=1 Tax=Aridibaculum aurantiacum TaxID=2810307 RepID=UPI001A969117|nr:DUF3347 domain-containing protein [Aridibaculum aurantiacum]